MKVLIQDEISTGHHISYFKSLIFGLSNPKIKYYLATPYSIIEEASSDSGSHYHCILMDASEKSNVMASLKNYIKIIKMLNREKIDLLHNLYIDRRILWLIPILMLTRTRIVSTLHWVYFFEQNGSKLSKLKRRLELCILRLFKRRITLIVHSDSSRTVLNNFGMTSVEHIPYPAEISSRVSGNKVVSGEILIFGGTRYDKGSDIAIKSLKYLNPYFKIKIVGKEEDIKYSDLIKIAELDGVLDRVKFSPDFVSDDAMYSAFSSAEFVLIPYRKNFSGQSGPLMTAAAMGKRVIASDLPAFRENIYRYRLGHVFEPENIEDMARVINGALDSPFDPLTERFLLDHSREKFAQRHEQLYAKIRPPK